MVATAVDVTDATFQAEIVERSMQVPVVVDLWAEWCGPCRQLGPILEKVVGATDGRVVLAKIDVDSNPQAAAAFQVQSIPAVYALRHGRVVDHFIGALPESQVQVFVDSLLPSETEIEVERLLGLGDEASLRAALELEPGESRVVTALAGRLAARGEVDEVEALLKRIPETAETRHIAAQARAGDEVDDDVDGRLAALLPQVKADADARQEFVDLLELLGPEDPRTAGWRKKLTLALY